jgi:hypothetical protein
MSAKIQRWRDKCKIACVVDQSQMEAEIQEFLE